MKWNCLTIALLVFGTACLASQEKPTPDELLQTVKHIQSLARDVQSDLDKEKEQHALAQKALGEANKRADKLAQHDKEVSDQLNDANKKLWWYRLHWWGSWIVLGIGVLLSIVFAFLKFTGRLSIAAAGVAAKI